MEANAEQKCCCETVTDVKCLDCDCWICEDCSSDDTFYCKDCCKNSTIRGTCISCEHIDNLEEGTECNKCGHWVCISYASYKDDGNYYCVDCFAQ